MRKTQLILRRRSARAQHGFVEFGPFRWACTLGRNGTRALKREGDGATPIGRHRLLSSYYRPDRQQGGRRPIHGALPLKPLRPGMGWCDAPGDANYNREIRFPYRASAETLWRDDRLYDLVVVLDYNISPRVRGKGSAIFMHVARPGLLPTEGCIAMRASHLRMLLAHVPRGRSIIIS